MLAFERFGGQVNGLVALQTGLACESLGAVGARERADACVDTAVTLVFADVAKLQAASSHAAFDARERGIDRLVVTRRHLRLDCCTESSVGPGRTLCPQR